MILQANSGLFIEKCIGNYGLGKTYGNVTPHSDKEFRYDEFKVSALSLKQSLSIDERRRAAAFLRAVTRTWLSGGKSQYLLHNGTVIPLLLLLIGDKQPGDVSMVRQMATQYSFLLS